RLPFPSFPTRRSSDLFEFAFALPARALHRIENAVLVIGPLLIVGNLHAQAAVRIWILRIALHANGAPAVVHLDEHGAGVGTIVRADGSDHFHFRFPAFVAAFFIESISWPRRS